jgi:hypothetical protein
MTTAARSGFTKTRMHFLGSNATVAFSNLLKKDGGGDKGELGEVRATGRTGVRIDRGHDNELRVAILPIVSGRN